MSSINNTFSIIEFITCQNDIMSEIYDYLRVSDIINLFSASKYLWNSFLKTNNALLREKILVYASSHSEFSSYDGLNKIFLIIFLCRNSSVETVKKIMKNDENRYLFLTKNRTEEMDKKLLKEYNIFMEKIEQKYYNWVEKIEKLACTELALLKVLPTNKNKKRVKKTVNIVEIIREKTTKNDRDINEYYKKIYHKFKNLQNHGEINKKNDYYEKLHFHNESNEKKNEKINAIVIATNILSFVVTHFKEHNFEDIVLEKDFLRNIRCLNGVLLKNACFSGNIKVIETFLNDGNSKRLFGKNFKMNLKKKFHPNTKIFFILRGYPMSIVSSLKVFDKRIVEYYFENIYPTIKTFMEEKKALNSSNKGKSKKKHPFKLYKIFKYVATTSKKTDEEYFLSFMKKVFTITENNYSLKTTIKKVINEVYLRTNKILMTKKIFDYVIEYYYDDEYTCEFIMNLCLQSDYETIKHTFEYFSKKIDNTTIDYISFLEKYIKKLFKDHTFQFSSVEHIIEKVSPTYINNAIYLITGIMVKNVETLLYFVECLEKTNSKVVLDNSETIIFFIKKSHVIEFNTYNTIINAKKSGKYSVLFDKYDYTEIFVNYLINIKIKVSDNKYIKTNLLQFIENILLFLYPNYSKYLNEEELLNIHSENCVLDVIFNLVKKYPKNEVNKDIDPEKVLEKIKDFGTIHEISFIIYNLLPKNVLKDHMKKVAKNYFETKEYVEINSKYFKPFTILGNDVIESAFDVILTDDYDKKHINVGFLTTLINESENINKNTLKVIEKYPSLLNVYDILMIDIVFDVDTYTKFVATQKDIMFYVNTRFLSNYIFVKEVYGKNQLPIITNKDIPSFEQLFFSQIKPNTDILKFLNNFICSPAIIIDDEYYQRALKIILKLNNYEDILLKCITSSYFILFKKIYELEKVSLSFKNNMLLDYAIKNKINNDIVIFLLENEDVRKKASENNETKNIVKIFELFNSE